MAFPRSNWIIAITALLIAGGIVIAAERTPAAVRRPYSRSLLPAPPGERTHAAARHSYSWSMLPAPPGAQDCKEDPQCFFETARTCRKAMVTYHDKRNEVDEQSMHIKSPKHGSNLQMTFRFEILGKDRAGKCSVRIANIYRDQAMAPGTPLGFLKSALGPRMSGSLIDYPAKCKLPIPKLITSLEKSLDVSKKQWKYFWMDQLAYYPKPECYIVSDIA